MAGFFFLGPRWCLGTPPSPAELWALPGAGDGALADDVAAAGFGCGLALGSARRELKVEMNSMTWGESPSMLLKCSAASSLDSVAAYSSTCCSPSSGSGRSWKSCSLDMMAVDRDVAAVVEVVVG